MARLRIANLNVWGHPDWIGRDGERRMRAVVATLGSLDVDVFAVQEVWTSPWRAILRDGAREQGFVHQWSNEKTIGGSGLLILSRLPLREPRFRRFAVGGMAEHVHHGDYYSGKGFATAGIETSEGEVLFLNTHLQAGYSLTPEDQHRGQRVAQLVEIASSLADWTGPVVAAGDFNLREAGPEYPIVTGLARLRDAAAELDRRQDTVLADHPYRGAGHLPGERIDYVFVRDGERATARPVSVERTFDEWLDFDGQRGAHSDHAGLRAEIEIGPRAPSVLPGPDPEAIAEAREWLEWGRNEARERQGRRRHLAGGGFAGAVAAGGGAVALRGDRRTILRVVLWAACAAGLSVAGLATLIAQRTVPAELVGYDRVEAALDALAGA